MTTSEIFGYCGTVILLAIMVGFGLYWGWGLAKLWDECLNVLWRMIRGKYRRKITAEDLATMPNSEWERVRQAFKEAHERENATKTPYMPPPPAKAKVPEPGEAEAEATKATRAEQGEPGEAEADAQMDEVYASKSGQNTYHFRAHCALTLTARVQSQTEMGARERVRLFVLATNGATAGRTDLWRVECEPGDAYIRPQISYVNLVSIDRPSTPTQ